MPINSPEFAAPTVHSLPILLCNDSFHDDLKVSDALRNWAKTHVCSEFEIFQRIVVIKRPMRCTVEIRITSLDEFHPITSNEVS